MGQSLDAFCTDCKKSYHLGYGGAKFHKELEEAFPKHLHPNHDFTFYSNDYTHEKDGHLWQEMYIYDDELWVENFSSFKHLNLLNVPRDDWEKEDALVPCPEVPRGSCSCCCGCCGSCSALGCCPWLCRCCK